MASFVFNSFAVDAFNGNCNTIHSYKGFLVGSGYAGDPTHSKRSSITNEITATGYSAGGVAVSLSVAYNSSSNNIILTVGSATFPAMTGTARKLIVYRFRNGIATADELVCCNDKGADFSFTNTGLVWPASVWLIPMPAPV